MSIKLPDVGEGIAEAEIVEWHVKSATRSHEDQSLADVMTDKATSSCRRRSPGRSPARRRGR